MTNKNKCRICLVDGAKHPIFEGIESKSSIHTKLFQCFKEKIEDIEGYPRKLCDSCIAILDTLYNFIKKFKTSCKVLESGLIAVKKEPSSENESDMIKFKEEMELEIFKHEPDSDGLEPLDDFWESKQLTTVKKKKKSLTDIKSKLKRLKDINFKRKPVRKSSRRTNQVASSILEAEFDWNGESLQSSKLMETKEETPKEEIKHTKLLLPKTPQPIPQKLCDICGEIFKDYDKLSQHKQRKHFSKPVKCPECPRMLASQYYLKRHLKRSHDKVKSFICDSCGRGFAFKGELTTHYKVVHLRILRPKKKHVCDKCDKGFVTAKSLVIHERSAHTGLRPAECDVCGACFYHEDYLKEHVRLHTGETPFKCPICGRGYAQRGNMRSHMSHNHRLADLSPETISTLKPSWFKFLKKPL